jgi:hypothetical protein
MTLKDDGEEIRLYRILNPHVEALMIGYVVKPNIVWATDLLSGSGDPSKTGGGRALALALQRFGIKNAMIARGNGTTIKQPDLTGVLGQ